ncbi:MAG: hypothetical protein Kow0042_07790 [Calditrichia bacterium]
MIKSVVIILLFSLLFFSPDMGFSDYREVISIPGPNRTKIPEYSPILFRAYPLALDSSTLRLYLLAEIQYDYMQFTRQGDQFVAEFQLEVHLKQEKSKALFDQSWTSRVAVKRFEETNKRNRYFLTLDSLKLPAGRYKLRLIYRDLQGSQRTQMDMVLNLFQPKNFYASPPLFCDPAADARPIPGPFPGKPLSIREHLPFHKSLLLFLNTWTPHDEPVHVSLSCWEEDNPTPLYAQDTVITPQNSRAGFLVEPPFWAWKEGKYRFKMIYRTAGDSIQQNLPVSLIWFSKPRSLLSPKYAREVFQALLEPQEEQNASANDEDTFIQYWKDQDPTPGTAYNEAMAEFYSRVDSADIRWGKGRRNGWQTDVGQIYVLYGKPDRIEDHSLDPENPHMTWYYEFPDRRLIFTFQSLEGRKRYKLVGEEEELKQ